MDETIKLFSREVTVRGLWGDMNNLYVCGAKTKDLWYKVIKTGEAPGGDKWYIAIVPDLKIELPSDWIRGKDKRHKFNKHNKDNNTDQLPPITLRNSRKY